MGKRRIVRKDKLLSPLEIYLRDINRIPLLSEDKEKELAKKGDEASRQLLVESNLRLVVNMARGFVGKGLALLDLIQEGNRGLIRAMEDFDGTTRVSSYASWWIKHAIRRAIVNTARRVRIPVYMCELIVKWNRIARKLADDWHRSPEFEEVLSEFQLSTGVKLSRKKQKALKRALRIHAGKQVGPRDDNGMEFLAAICVERSGTPETIAVLREDLARLSQEVDKLDKTEATIIRARFGLPPFDEQGPMTHEEIGELIGRTRARIGQREPKILAKLAEAMGLESEEEKSRGIEH